MFQYTTEHEHIIVCFRNYYYYWEVSTSISAVAGTQAARYFITKTSHLLTKGSIMSEAGLPPGQPAPPATLAPVAQSQFMELRKEAGTGSEGISSVWYVEEGGDEECH
jgi:hypothetical protein